MEGCRLAQCSSPWSSSLALRWELQTDLLDLHVRVGVPLRDRRRDGHWGAEAQSYSRVTVGAVPVARAGLSEKKPTSRPSR